MSKSERKRRGRVVCTTVRFTPRAWLLLRDLAAAQALAAGADAPMCRPSASAFLEQLVEAEAERRGMAARISTN